MLVPPSEARGYEKGAGSYVDTQGAGNHAGSLFHPVKIKLQ